MSPPARTQFDCLHAGYLPAIHGKSQQGSDEVPSIVAAGAGIHVNVKVLFGFAEENVAGMEERSGRKLERTRVELNRDETLGYVF